MENSDKNRNLNNQSLEVPFSMFQSTYLENKYVKKEHYEKSKKEIEDQIKKLSEITLTYSIWFKIIAYIVTAIMIPFLIQLVLLFFR